MREKIKDLIESYEHKLEDVEYDAQEQKFCNTFSQGVISAYTRVINDLYDLLGEEV